MTTSTGSSTIGEPDVMGTIQNRLTSECVWRKRHIVDLIERTKPEKSIKRRDTIECRQAGQRPFVSVHAISRRGLYVPCFRRSRAIYKRKLLATRLIERHRVSNKQLCSLSDFR